MSPDIGANVLLELARSSTSRQATPESLAQLERETREMYRGRANAYYATSRCGTTASSNPIRHATCSPVSCDSGTLPPHEGRSYVYRM